MSRTIHIIGQQPIHLRYQEWFADAIVDGLRSQDCVVHQTMHPIPVPGSSDFFKTILPYSIDHELFQLRTAINLVQADDVILCLDASLPGVSGLIAATCKPCKMAAIVHGSSFNKMDIFPKDRQCIEAVTFSAFDKLFVASEYHKSKLAIITSPIVNMGWLPSNPHLQDFIDHHYSEDKLIPGSVCCVARDTPQKRQRVWEEAFTAQTGAVVNYPTNPFEYWEEYFEFIARHEYMLVTAQEETFGYPIQEAMTLGVKPICPNMLCYPEFVPQELLYGADFDPGLCQDFRSIYQRSLGLPLPPKEVSDYSKDIKFFKQLAEELMSL